MSLKRSNLCFSIPERNECIKANAKSCGECIQVGAKCGWCMDPVRGYEFANNIVTALMLHNLNIN